MQAAPDVTFSRGLGIIDFGNLAVGEVLAKLNTNFLLISSSGKGDITQNIYIKYCQKNRIFYREHHRHINKVY